MVTHRRQQEQDADTRHWVGSWTTTSTGMLLPSPMPALSNQIAVNGCNKACHTFWLAYLCYASERWTRVRRHCSPDVRRAHGVACVVTAMDATHDQSHGMNAPGELAEILWPRVSRAPRVQTPSQIAPWQAGREGDWRLGVVHRPVPLPRVRLRLRHLPGQRPVQQADDHRSEGRGAFTRPNDFVDGAVNALRLERFVGAEDWRIARFLYRLKSTYGYRGEKFRRREYQRCEDG